MRKFLVTVTVVIFVASLAYAGLLKISRELDSEAEEAVLAYAADLNEYKIHHGHYPETLDDVVVNRNKVASVISPGEIRYISSEAAVLYYSQFPLGPKHVCNLNTKVWRFEE